MLDLVGNPKDRFSGNVAHVFLEIVPKEPCHGETCFWHMRKTKVYRSVAPLFFSGYNNVSSFKIISSVQLAS